MHGLDEDEHLSRINHVKLQCYARLTRDDRLATDYFNGEPVD